MKKTHDDYYSDLEFFEDKAGWRGNDRVTIRTHETIHCNAAFSKRAKLNKETLVRLGYSPKRKEIIFDFTEDPKAPGAYSLVQSGKTSFTIACRSFFRAYNFNMNEIAGRYIPRKERIPKIGECWLIKLAEKVEK
jgi:hypothetical protein